MSGLFAYEAAFSRNLGWVTQAEQTALRGKRIAIAGMGGVGGGHLLTLARLGVGSFSISDFDTFDLANFNRQAGAFVSSLGRPKAEVLAAMVADINPECELRVFGEGVSGGNLEDFLGGADLYVDALDFFAFDIRRAVFAACHRMGIPAVTAAPLGLGAAVLVFQPDGMSFEEYFQLEGCDEEEMAVRFLIGLSPAMLQFGYLADPSRVRPGRAAGAVRRCGLPAVFRAGGHRVAQDPARTRRRPQCAAGLSVRCLPQPPGEDLAAGWQSQPLPALRDLDRETAIDEDEAGGEGGWPIVRP